MNSSKAKLYARYLTDAAERSSKTAFEKMAERFARLLRQRGDAKLAGTILKEFARIQHSRGKEREALAITAHPLSDALRSRLERELAKHDYALKEEVRPEVRNGIALFLGKTHLLDATVRSKLNQLFFPKK